MKYYKLVLVFLLGVMVLFGCSKEDDDKDENNQVNSEENIENEEIVNVENDINEDEQEVSKSERLGEEAIVYLQELPEVPTTLDEVVDQTAGPFAMSVVDWNDEKFNELYEEFERIGPLPEEATEEDLELYFKFLYTLAAYNYPDPQDIIKKWEFGSFGDPELPDSRFHFKENYNVEVLLDGSGSMGAYIGNKTMMQIAKESINNFLETVPEEANISFRVYGHKGSGSNADKEMSCSTIEQVYGYEPYNADAFQTELDKIQPAGWTPLADALKQAEEALKEFDTENHTNLIYVVSDGVETCDGDPVQVAKSLADSNAKPIINIIGFNVNSEAQKQLKEMADVSGGIYATANNQEELEEEFKRAEKVLKAWEEWRKDALKDVDHQSVRNSFDILEFANDWWRKEERQYLNLSRIIDEAFDKELLTSKQKEYFMTRRNQVRDLIKTGGKDLEENLKEISIETIEQLKKEIEERYEHNTNE